jgi:hypothetical protein
MMDRRHAYSKYIELKLEQEKGNRQKKYESDREKLRRLFSTREDITGSTRFKTMASVLGSDSVYKSTLEEFREKIFDEYVSELRQREKVGDPLDDSVEKKD